jgi:N-methylhydantoinase B/oxoprolinase/acetone carboxylase alpha subunit
MSLRYELEEQWLASGKRGKPLQHVRISHSASIRNLTLVVQRVVTCPDRLRIYYTTGGTNRVIG